MPKINEERRQERLSRLHREYRGWSQAEPVDCRFMADSGHPEAADYETLRAEFDRLSVACNSSTRLIAFKNERHCAEYDAPELNVSWRPEKFCDRRFGHVYPAMGERWNEYLRAAAEAGWPDAVGPGIDYGSFTIRTDSAPLISRLYRICKGDLDLPDKRVGFESRDSVRIRPNSAKQALAVFKAVRSNMKRWALPDLTEADRAADAVESPLFEKRLLLGNVEEVTVAVHAVLVPLVPIGDRGSEVILRTVERLLELVEEGFPYQQVRRWLTDTDGKARFVTPAALRRFDRQYHASV